MFKPTLLWGRYNTYRAQWGLYDYYLTYGEGDNNDEDIQLEFLLGVPRPQNPPPRGALPPAARRVRRVTLDRGGFVP